jgi:hypothetical protein
MAITRLGGANAITGTLPAANINDTSIGNITALPAGVGGKVLQVSNLVRATSSQTIATSTYTDLTSLSLSITPSSTSNKILLVANIQANVNDDEGFGIRFLRDSTNIYDAGNQELAGHQGGATVVLQVVNAVYIDSPSSTSAITYKVQSGTRNSTSVVFNDGYYSEFYLMEIAG